MSYQPKLNPRMSWRLHPADYVAVVAEMKEFTLKRDIPFMLAGDLRILGIKVYTDDDAPRIEVAQQKYECPSCGYGKDEDHLCIGDGGP